MCGLAGIYQRTGERVEAAHVQKMIDVIRYRGPDDSGIWLDDEIGLAHVRLAILDPSANAAQPMCSHDGRYVLAFNGEIYNFPTLRNTLQRQGVQFRSTGDTEVLLEHIRAHGVAATLPDLEGDFAFALWDRVERRLVLARDRYGVKPLYYHEHRGELRFASECKALCVERCAPDLVTLNATLVGLSPAWGDRTLFAGVHAVQPGEWLEFSEGTTVRRHRFFTVAEFVDEPLWRELSRLPRQAVVDRVSAELEASTERRMVTDAPMACLVSGGVDSSLVTAIATRHHPELGLYHADVLQDSERSAAELMASAVGSRLRVAEASDDAMLAAIADATWFNELPLTYLLNGVPFLLVSRLASAEGIKVLLTGEGSDEYFLGYPRNVVAGVLDVVNSAKRATRSAAHRLAPRLMMLLWPKREEEFSELLRGLVSRYQEDVIVRDAEDAFEFLHPRRRRPHVMTLTLASTHLLALLHRNDRMGMACGIEARFPYLGHGLTRIAMNLPGHYKLRLTPRAHDRRHPFVVDKWVVRAAAQQQIPNPLAQRTKHAFPVSLAGRLSIGPELFHDGFVAEVFGLDRRAIATAVEVATPVWLFRLLLLEVWGQMFVLGHSARELQDNLIAVARRSGR